MGCPLLRPGEIGSAVDVDIRAGYKAAVVRHQVGHRAGDFLRIALTAQGCASGDSGAHFILGEGVMERGCSHAGAQRIAAGKKVYASVCLSDMKARANEHKSICAALRNRDPAAARIAMREHFHRLFDAMLVATENSAPEEVQRAG